MSLLSSFNETMVNVFLQMELVFVAVSGISIPKFILMD